MDPSAFREHEWEEPWGEATTAHGGGGQHSLAGHLRQPWYSRDLRGGEKLCLQGTAAFLCTEISTVCMAPFI